MAKPRILNQRKANIEHKKRTERYAQLIQQIYDRVAQEAARLASIAGADPSKPFSFDDYPLTKEAIKRLQSQFNADVYAVIMAGTSEEWKESNLVQNLVANKVLGAYVGTDRNGEENTRYYQTNPDALKAFQERRESGMNLSDRVWNLSEQYRVELEDAISVAIAPGVSAQQLSLDVRKYLNEPDLMFRRFRYKDENGRWKRKWKKRYRDEDGNVRFMDCDRDSYKNQWTGPGYYKSSAKNAMRLARTEINMAYRTAEQKRWEQFDFVVGYEVKTTQNGKHIEDICDQLAGKYPKNFKFTGWHPQCYDELSEVLTRQGWKRFKDVVDSDEILSLNPETRELEWVSIVDRQCYDHTGDMIHFFNRSLDCLVTPEHRMVYLNKSNGEIRYCQAEDFSQEIGSFIHKEGESNVSSIAAFKKEVEQYSGKVYDLTLERNHIMYIRRNGKCFWGSNCMCYCIPILKTEDEFWAYDSKNPQKSANEITELPSNFREWINDNRERIEAAEKRGKLPYFIRDNREDVKDILNPKERKKTPLEIAVERHAARTKKDAEQIQSAWQRRVIRNLSNEAIELGKYDELYDQYLSSLRVALRNNDSETFKENYAKARIAIRDLSNKIKGVFVPYTPHSAMLSSYSTLDEVRLSLLSIGNDNKWFPTGRMLSLQDTCKGANGSSNRITGTVKLTPERAKLVTSAMGKIGKGQSWKMTKEEADAMATLWHEMTHQMHIGDESPGLRYSKSRSYMELANEYVSRKTLSDFYKAMGCKYTPYPGFMENRDSTGYNTMVNLLQEVINIAKLNKKDTLQSLKDGLIHTKYDNQKSTLVNGLVLGGMKGKWSDVAKLIEMCESEKPIDSIKRFMKSVGLI